VTAVDPVSVEARLRDIQSITDAALSRLDDLDLLAELLDRTRDVLQADTAAVLLLDFSSGQLIATAAAGLEEEVRQGVRIPVGHGFAGRIAAEHRPVVLDRVDHTTVMNPILWSKGIRSMAGVPMVASGRVIGVLHVGSLTPRRFTSGDVELLQLAGDRAAAAVQSMTAAADRAAAVIMGRMRSTLRAYALETTDPSEVVGRLDRKMQHFEPDALATVVYAVMEPGLHQMHVALAGHFPPVIARPGQPAELADIRPGALIGAAPRTRRPVTTVAVPPGALLCFYTDGLVERPGEVIDEGLDRLCRAVTAQSPEAACATVMGALVGSEPARDDIALLMIRRHAGRETDTDA